MIRVFRNIFSVSQNFSCNNGRIEVLDFLRGLAMILVLLHHSGFPYGNWILAFHMPLFFVLSGYTDSLNQKKERQPFIRFVIKRLKRLIIPFFVFEILNLVIWYIKCCVFNESFHIFSSIISIFLCINTNAYTGLCGRLWFLPCMFVTNIFFWLITRLIKNKPGLICSIGVLFFVSWLTTTYIPFRLPFTIDTAFMATAFMLIGYCGKVVFSYLIEKGHITIDIILCALMLGLLYYTYRSDKGKMLMYVNEYGDYVYSILGAIGGIIAFFIISKYIYFLLKRIKLLNQFILWYSYNSLATFPVHLEIKGILILFGIPWLSNWYILFFIMLFGNIIIVNIITNYLPFMIGQKS